MYDSEAAQNNPQRIQATLFSSPRFRNFPLINWAAIFAGLVAGLATYVLLTLMGAASGVSSIDINAAGAGVNSVSMWTAIWNGISMLISAFVGGFVSARVSGLRRKLDGLMHGLVAWGATTLLFVVISTSATAKLFDSVFNTLAQPPATTSTQTQAPGSFIDQLRAAIAPNINANALNNQNIDQLQTLIKNRDRQGAVDFMTVNMGISADKANILVDQLMIVAGNPELSSPETRSEINKTVSAAGKMLWVLFLSVLLSAVVSIWGGMLGTRNVSRTQVNIGVPAATVTAAA